MNRAVQVCGVKGSLPVVERVLKESEHARCELVRDEGGNRFIRKTFYAPDEGLEQRYRELARQSLPGVPRILSVTREYVSGAFTVVREYTEGYTLRQWVTDNGPLTVAEARTVLGRLCETVRALHALDPPLIHRDITPSNIVLSGEGPVLIDFGISRRWSSRSSRDTVPWGTVGYAAPAQLGYGQSDVRTDVYALGMV